MSEPDPSVRGNLDLDDREPPEQTEPHESPAPPDSAEAVEAQKPPAQDVDDDSDRDALEIYTEPGKRPATSAAITIACGLLGIGFLALAFAWREISELDNVAEQMPYVLSGGLTGLALIIIGAVLLDVAVRRQDSRQRRDQLTEVTRTLAELRKRVERSERDE